MGDVMKKFISAVGIICIVFLFSACGQNNISESPDTPNKHTEINDEYESVLASDNLSNAHKNDMIHQLAQEQIDRAENYRSLIKEEYKNIIDEYDRVGINKNIQMSYEELCSSLDEYFNCLKNEFEANADFFEKQAYAIYGTGTAGASYLVNKEYECAKFYADKAQKLYEELK